ncbi:MAG: cellulose synthase family protein [Bacteroidota bacterium]
MGAFAYILFAIYTLALVYITLYCLMQLNLLYYYKKNQWRNTDNPAPADIPRDQLPMVTIQLPIFNEKYVVERLIDNITSFDYPKDRLEIQVLDDSTDETVDISRKKIAEYKTKGFDISLWHRKDRSGYKAGALKEATVHAKGEFIAIFDADFLPRPDFLLNTIPHFQQAEVALVQTRWVHINENYSLITRLQAMQLNVHFTVEQQGRRAGNCLLQFNGTAGIWRRSAIDDAGGWETDTLTEDLDLSYRAQLKGWQIVYLERFPSPAELPAEMNGLKSQQFRWMKGGAENARKLMPTVWRSHLSFWQKLHASAHLMGSSVFIFVFISGIFSVPLLFGLHQLGIPMGWFGIFLIALVAIIAVHYVANVQQELEEHSYGKLLFKFIFLFPLFLALSMGLSLHNTIAVLQGYRGKKSPFVRTPKFNIKNIKDSFRKQSYVHTRLSWITIFEGVLTIYFTAAFIYGMQVQANPFLLFHLMLAVGFGAIFYFSVRHLGLK